MDAMENNPVRRVLAGPGLPSESDSSRWNNRLTPSQNWPFKSHASGIANVGYRCIGACQGRKLDGADSMTGSEIARQTNLRIGGAARLAVPGRTATSSLTTSHSMMTLCAARQIINHEFRIAQFSRRPTNSEVVNTSPHGSGPVAAAPPAGFSSSGRGLRRHH